MTTTAIKTSSGSSSWALGILVRNYRSNGTARRRLQLGRGHHYFSTATTMTMTTSTSQDVAAFPRRRQYSSKSSFFFTYPTYFARKIPPQWQQHRQTSPSQQPQQQQQQHQQQQRRGHYQYPGPGSPLSSFSPDEDDKHNHIHDQPDDLMQRPTSTTTTTQALLQNLWRKRNFWHRGFTVGIGGPVGSGKTATVLALCRSLTRATLQDPHDQESKNAASFSSLTSSSLPLPPAVAVVTNDIFTQEDAEFLIRNNALPAEYIAAVETGGCPHAAIREDVSANLSALEDLTKRALRKNQSSQPPPLLFCESGGDNLAANFSRELADLTLYVIDVAGGDKVPRKGGPGITESDLLIINKIDLADAVGANLTIMEQQAQDMRQYKSLKNNNKNNDASSSSSSAPSFAPIVMASIKQKQGLQEIVDFILSNYHQAMAMVGQPLVTAQESGIHNHHDHGHDHSHSHSHSHHHEH
ncbi:hypothetical protein ACA910_005378 [Epithemia clementina (nom. ined.)]